jgi:hypothetical protein
MFVVLAETAFTVRFKVTTESQPAAFTKVSLKVPAALYTLLFHE